MLLALHACDACGGDDHGAQPDAARHRAPGTIRRRRLFRGHRALRALVREGTLRHQRFAQVGRYPRQHEEHQWPAEYYPFTYVAVPDPFTERNEGLWQRPKTDPLVIHLHTEGDYWVRHVSLTHTDPRDGSDVAIPATARLYHLTGAPHMVRAMDDPDWIGQLTPNAVSAIPFRRAVLVLLDRWATHGTPPPPSLLPQAADGTLVTAEEVLARYPKIPGVNLPEGPSRLPRYNYGPDFDRHGIMSVFPPRPCPGQEYPLRVPQIDKGYANSVTLCHLNRLRPSRASPQAVEVYRRSLRT